MSKSGFGRSRFNRDRFSNRGGGGGDNRRDFGGGRGGGGGGGGNRGGNSNANARDNFNNKGNYGRPNGYESKDVPMKDNYGNNKGNDYNNRDNFGRDRDRTDIHSSGRSRFSDIPKTENASRFSNHTDGNAGSSAAPRSGGSRFQSGGGSRFSNNNDNRAPAADSYQSRNKDDHSNNFYDTSSVKYNRPPPAISSAVTQSNSGYPTQSNQYNYNHQGDTSRPPLPQSNGGGNYQYGMPAFHFPPPPLPTK